MSVPINLGRLYIEVTQSSIWSWNLHPACIVIDVYFTGAFEIQELMKDWSS